MESDHVDIPRVHKVVGYARENILVDRSICLQQTVQIYDPE